MSHVLLEDELGSSLHEPIDTTSLKPVARNFDSRRLRMFFLDERTLCDLLRGAIRAANIPEGMEIVQCAYDLNRWGFNVLVKHPSFDIVPDGDVIPHFGPIMLELVNRTPLVANYTPEQAEEIKRLMRDVPPAPPSERREFDLTVTCESKEPYVGLDGSIN